MAMNEDQKASIAVLLKCLKETIDWVEEELQWANEANFPKWKARYELIAKAIAKAEGR